jgi:hypothetical protein
MSKRKMISSTNDTNKDSDGGGEEPQLKKKKKSKLTDDDCKAQSEPDNCPPPPPANKKPWLMARDPWQVVVKFMTQQEYLQWLLTHKSAKRTRFEGPSVRVFDGNLLPPSARMPEHWFWRRRIRIESLQTPWSRNADLPNFDIEAVSTRLWNIVNVTCRHLLLFNSQGDAIYSTRGLHATIITLDAKSWCSTSTLCFRYCEEINSAIVNLSGGLEDNSKCLKRLRGVFDHQPYECGPILPKKLEYLELSNVKCETCSSKIKKLCAEQNCVLKIEG